MMKWLAILLLSASPVLADAYKITRVIDGDTVEIAVDFLPAPLPPKLSIRVLGIDTPEKAPRAQCEAEAEKAKLASAFTKNAIATAGLNAPPEIGPPNKTANANAAPIAI